MSNEKHTQEPWSYDGHSGIAATNSDQLNDGYFTAEVMGPDKDANARRIVACVNACAGVPTELLETVAAFGGFCRDDMVQHVTKQRDDLQAELTAARNCLLREGMQRDTLLAALEETNSCLLSALTGGSVKVSRAAKALRDADAAIASVKGGAA